MQIKIFTIPVCDPEDCEKEVNTFMGSHRVLDVVHEFVQDGANSRWCLLIKTMTNGSGLRKTNSRKNRVDYRDILDEASFTRFCALRKARKSVADREGVPAFALFTDKQMAELARLDPLSLEGMRTVEGIGPGKTDKYGPAILRLLGAGTEKPESEGSDETGG